MITGKTIALTRQTLVSKVMSIHKIDSRWEFAVWLRKLKQGLYINLEGWEMGWNFKREGIHVYLWLIHVEV